MSPCPASSVFDWLTCLFADLPTNKPAGRYKESQQRVELQAVRGLSRSVCISLVENVVIALQIAATVESAWCVALGLFSAASFPVMVNPSAQSWCGSPQQRLLPFSMGGPVGASRDVGTAGPGQFAGHWLKIK